VLGRGGVGGGVLVVLVGVVRVGCGVGVVVRTGCGVVVVRG